MKEIYNKIIIKAKELKPKKEEKNKMIDECIELAQPLHKELALKHDGCRILQALIKHGNVN